MDFHLEREIRLSEEPEFKNLYSWSLQEFDGDGKKIGSDQIPWKWSLNYTDSELRHNIEIKIEQPCQLENEIEKNKIVEEYETITAILHPGVCNDGKWLKNDTYFSMFGTDRNIKHFGLNISKLDNEVSDERCNLWGCVSYTTEIDFRDETTDDTVQIYIWLSPERFNRLAELIKTQRADIFLVRLSEVSGFYSEWSPSISTDNIKVLASADDQKIVCQDGCNITPPNLGEVGEFNLSIVQRSKLNPKQDLRSINIYNLFEEPDEEEDEGEEDFAETKPDANALLLVQLSRNELALAKLRTPLWLIFVLLLILSIKLFL